MRIEITRETIDHCGHPGLAMNEAIAVAAGTNEVMIIDGMAYFGSRHLRAYPMPEEAIAWYEGAWSDPTDPQPLTFELGDPS